MTDRDVSIGIDIGGTKVLGVTLDANAKVLDRERASSLKDGRRDPGLNISLGVAERLRLRAEERGDVLLSVGIGVPEYVNEAGLLTSRLVMEWDVQVLDLFGHLGRVEVESDVRCAAIAESIPGPGGHSRVSCTSRSALGSPHALSLMVSRGGGHVARPSRSVSWW